MILTFYLFMTMFNIIYMSVDYILFEPKELRDIFEIPLLIVLLSIYWPVLYLYLIFKL